LEKKCWGVGLRIFVHDRKVTVLVVIQAPVERD